MVSVDHQKWLTKLMGYDFDIQYKPGLENKAVDALSRVGSEPTLAALSIPRLKVLEELETQVMADEGLRQIVEALQEDPNSVTGYSMVQGQLLYKHRLVLPRHSPLIKAVLHELHDGCVGGHSGFLKTLKRIATTFYWVGMRGDIWRYVAECPVCQ